MKSMKYGERRIEYFGGPHDGVVRPEGPTLARTIVFIYPNGWYYARVGTAVEDDLEGWYGPAVYDGLRRYHRRYHIGAPPAVQENF